jgi:polyvinyl alcohol dehydrogenase (cytochrome)
VASLTVGLLVLLLAAPGGAAPGTPGGPAPAVSGGADPAGADPAGPAGDAWTQFLHDPAHGSFAASATAITPATVPALVPAWPHRFRPDRPSIPGQPTSELLASPVVAGGRVFIGSNNGVMYALDEATGAVLWRNLLGYQEQMTCAGLGIISTAAVAADPVTGEQRVYVAAGDGRLYALAAATGAVRWTARVVDPGIRRNQGMPWSSPILDRGRIYMGMSSNCDFPLIQGGLKEFDQATGTLLATYHTVPDGQVGGSIWSTAASAGGRVFVTTGNGDPSGGMPGDSFSIVGLDGKSLARLGAWTVPRADRVVDSDFGASPTVWSVTSGNVRSTFVGACNKNGRFYALDAHTLRLRWFLQAGDPHLPGSRSGLCLGSAVWDGAHLFVGGPATTIEGTEYHGSVRQVDPATGAIRWETGLPAAVQGSPTLSGGGVIAANTYDFAPGAVPGVYLLDAATGALLRTLSRGDSTFAQPAFAGPYVFVATVHDGVMAYRAG